MGVYQLGTAVTITETFSLLGVPTSPTTVTYTVQDPNGVDTTYVYGVAPEVSNPSPGVFVLQLPALTVPGKWLYNVIGDGAVVAVGSGEFTILQSAIDPAAVVGPQQGPCTPWIDCGDISALCDTTDLALLDGIAQSAGEILFQLSGRKFTGRCQQTVRPCADGCGCWPAWTFPGLSPGAPQYPVGGGGWGWWGTGWGWGSTDCGCQPLSQALLPGYPVTVIDEVKIDGIVLSPDEYRLDEYQWLVRMGEVDGSPNLWPGCQRLDLPDTEENTWSATYTYGAEVPLAGKYAAQQLACEIYASLSGGDCKLPAGTVQVTRAGITVQKAPFTSWAQIDGRWASGLPLVDLFLASSNPSGLQRRPVVWAPGMPKYAKKQVGV